MSPTWCYIIACLLLPAFCLGQALGKVDQAIQLPDKLFTGLNKKISGLEDRLTTQSEKYLKRLAKRERRIRRKLSAIDSTAAKKLFDNSDQQYAKLLSKLKSNAGIGNVFSGEYLPHLDSLQGMLSYLNDDKLIIPREMQGKAKAVLDRFKQLQSCFQGAEAVKTYLRERKQQIKGTLSRYTGISKNLTKGLADYNKEMYYYMKQVREYKEMLNDPDKLTKKALSLVKRLPAFQEFMKQHSQLAGLFGVPVGYGNIANVGGLQTRAQVQSMVQGQLSAAGPNGQQILQQNLQAAQAQLNKLKDKLKQLGQGSGDIEMPDFKPNNQRTKSFLQRLEIGTNLQSTKSNFFFPTTTDFGVSIGYKIADNSVIGIGGSFKVGWGKDIRNVVVTSEGAGLRSFLDIKLKGSFYLSGGFEYNYQPIDTAGIKLDGDWTSSGLVGISKIVSLKSKFFKKTKLQLLWDFLSYRQLPQRPALNFRVGYAF